MSLTISLFLSVEKVYPPGESHYLTVSICGKSVSPGESHYLTVSICGKSVSTRWVSLSHCFHLWKKCIRQVSLTISLFPSVEKVYPPGESHYLTVSICGKSVSARWVSLSHCFHLWKKCIPQVSLTISLFLSVEKVYPTGESHYLTVSICGKSVYPRWVSLSHCFHLWEKCIPQVSLTISLFLSAEIANPSGGSYCFNLWTKQIPQVDVLGHHWWYSQQPWY